VARARIEKVDYEYKGVTQDRWRVRKHVGGCSVCDKLFKREDLAEEFATALDLQYHEGIRGKSKANILFDYAFAEWLKSEAARADLKNRNSDLGPEAFAHKEGAAKNHLLPWFKGKKLEEIDPKDIQAFVTEQARKFKHWTAVRHRSLINQVLDYAVSEGWLTINPMRRGVRIRVPGEMPIREDVPEIDDVEKLFKRILEGPRPGGMNVECWEGLKVQIVLIAMMGLGPGEAGGLRWDCVDLKKRTVEVKHGLTHLRLKGPKNRYRYRKIDMDQITYKALIEYVEWRKSQGLPLKSYVLTTAQNGKVKPSTMRNRHNRALELAGLVGPDGETNFSPHALRHFAGSVWLAQGMTLKDVSWRLGHRTTATTEKVYMHQLKHDERAKQIVARIHQAFPGLGASTAVTVAFAQPEVIDVIAEPVVPLLPAPTVPQPETGLRHGIPSRKPSPIEDCPRWVDAALDMIDQGASVVEIAQRLNRGESTVTHWLRVAGVPNPGKAAARNRRIQWEAKFAEMRAQGYQAREIALAVGCSIDIYKQWRREADRGENGEKTPEPLENQGD
jgi:integrase